MKIFNSLLLVIFAATLSLAGTSDVKTVDIKITGMTCSGCVTDVKGALEKIDGVQKANVSLKDSYAKVVYDTAKVNDEILTTAVTSIGYKVTSIKPSTSNEIKSDKAQNGCCGGAKKPCGSKSTI